MDDISQEEVNKYLNSLDPDYIKEYGAKELIGRKFDVGGSKAGELFRSWLDTQSSK